MKLLILYATTMGNSKGIANVISESLEGYNFEDKRVMAINQYNKELLIDENIVIFVCSSFGNGSVPKMMKEFWEYLLREQLPGYILSTIHFAVFGCGDTKFKLFNAASKKLYRRLLELGANPINELGLGNASNENGHYQTLYPWIEDLKKNLEEKGLVGASQNGERKYHYNIEYLNENSSNETKNDSTVRNEKIGEIFEITKNEKMTPNDYIVDTRFVLLNTSNNLSYIPGDIVSVCPVNLKNDVDEAIKKLHWEEIADKDFVIKANGNTELPENWKSTQTLRNLLERSLDIFGMPELKMGSSLYSSLKDILNESDKTKLSDVESYIKKCINDKKSIFDILCEFPTKDLKVEDILEIIPTIKPRSYSIASSRNVCGNNVIELIIAINNYVTANNELRYGISTKWISTLKPSEKIYAEIKEGVMKFDSFIKDPVIMICTGTGIASIRSCLQERVSQGQKENYLFFGFRNTGSDDYFRDELNKYSEEGNVKLYLAPSRDQEKKVYVQHKLEENSKLIYELITKKNAHIIVSGNINTLPNSVKTALRDIFIKEGGESLDQATKLVKDLEDKGIYQEECY